MSEYSASRKKSFPLSFSRLVRNTLPAMLISAVTFVFLTFTTSSPGEHVKLLFDAISVLFRPFSLVGLRVSEIFTAMSAPVPRPPDGVLLFGAYVIFLTWLAILSAIVMAMTWQFYKDRLYEKLRASIERDLGPEQVPYEYVQSEIMGGVLSESKTLWSGLQYAPGIFRITFSSDMRTAMRFWAVILVSVVVGTIVTLLIVSLPLFFLNEAALFLGYKLPPYQTFVLLHLLLLSVVLVCAASANMGDMNVSGAAIAKALEDFKRRVKMYRERRSSARTDA